MEYNTQREQLKINDYGRTVCKMIEYCKTLDDRTERTRVANTIIEAMATVNPKVRERHDYRHILWDHLMAMANYELDVDTPFVVMPREQTEMRPGRILRATGRIRYPHYGRSLEKMVLAVANMSPSDDRDRLTALLAHTMKRQYLMWNRDTVEDQVIAEQLNVLSDGRLALPEGFHFHDMDYYAEALASRKEQTAGKKKKKKKKR